MHREWYDRTAVRDLFGEGSFPSKSTLYGCLDRLVAHKGEMFEFLRDRWASLFASNCRVILCDLTSTYFEVDGTKAETSALLRHGYSHGYSRDKRGDCLQVVIALVLTPDGLPLAYEVMPGNTSDKGTQMQFVDRLVKKYGKDGKLDSRIEAHIFVSYVTYCLQATLKDLTRTKAGGLTPRQIFEGKTIEEARQLFAPAWVCRIFGIILSH